MSQEKHNGWANYETWLINLWDYPQLMVEACKENKHQADAKWCQEFFEQLVATEVPRRVGAVAALYLSALQKIDWREIAQHVNDELNKPS